MYLFYNNFDIFLKNIKILIIFSNFNRNLSYLLISNFYKRLSLFGFFYKDFLTLIVNGSLDIYFFLNILLDLNFFDVYIITGVILKNKTFHFDIISLNSNFFISKISYNYCTPIINFLIISNNKFYFLNKLIKISNDNLKIFLKYINLLSFLKFY